MRHQALVLLLVLAVTSLALACGDDEGSDTSSDPLDAYFADLGEIGSDFVHRLVIQPQGLDQSAPIADQVDIYETYVRGLADDIRAARDELNDLDAPPEVADAHAALLASVENALSVAESLEDELGAINSSEELQRLGNDPDAASALEQFQTACSALRDLAAQNNIQQEVRCE